MPRPRLQEISFYFSNIRYPPLGIASLTFLTALVAIFYQLITSVRVGLYEAISQTFPYLQMYEGDVPWTPFSRRPLIPFLARQIPENEWANRLEVPAFFGFAVVNSIFLAIALVAVISIWVFLRGGAGAPERRAAPQEAIPRLNSFVALLCVLTVFMSNGYTFRLNFTWPSWTDIGAMSLMVTVVALALWSKSRPLTIPILWVVCLLLPLTREITAPQMMAFAFFAASLRIMSWKAAVGSVAALGIGTAYAMSLPSSGAQYSQIEHLRMKLESHSLGFLIATIAIDLMIATGFGWLFFLRRKTYASFDRSLILIFALVAVIFAMTVVQLTDNGRFLLPAVVLFWLVFAGLAMRDSRYVAPLVGSTIGYLIVQNPFQLDGVIRYIQPNGVVLNSVSAEFFAFGTQITDFGTFLSLFMPQVVAGLVVTLIVTWALRFGLENVKASDWRRRKVEASR